MRELIAAVAGLGVLLYLMRNEKAPGARGIAGQKVEGFEPEILQNVLNLIQAKEPNLYPIDTVYFNKNSDSENSTYSGRFMFLNTDGFFGVQYDVESDGKTITSLSKSVPPDYQSPFSGYTSRGTVSLSSFEYPKPDMAKIHENLKTENISTFYRGNNAVSA